MHPTPFVILENLLIPCIPNSVILGHSIKLYKYMKAMNDSHSAQLPSNPFDGLASLPEHPQKFYSFHASRTLSPTNLKSNNPYTIKPRNVPCSAKLPCNAINGLAVLLEMACLNRKLDISKLLGRQDPIRMSQIENCIITLTSILAWRKLLIFLSQNHLQNSDTATPPLSTSKDNAASIQ